MAFQPSYPGAQEYDLNDIAGPGASNVFGVNAGANGIGGTVGMGNFTPADFPSIAGPGANNVYGVNAGANGIGGTVGMGSLTPADFPRIAGPGATDTPPPPAPAAGLTAADQAFADQVRQMYGQGSGQQLAMGNQFGPGGYAFARPNGAGGYGAYNPGGAGGMPGGSMSWPWAMGGGGGMQGGGGMPAGLLDALRALLMQYGIK